MVVDSLSEWLSSEELIGATGHCLSWANPQHPGYEYPELSGLLLSFLARAGRAPERRQQLQDLLAADAEPAGVRRGEITYAFDTAMALRGLLDARPAGAAHEPPAPQWTQALLAAVETATACRPAPPLGPHTRWSLSFGAHQAKLAAGLVAAAEHGVADTRAALARLRDRTLRLQEPDGRFTVHSESRLTYLHAHCYALEGLLMIGGADDAVAAGVAWLAQIQQPDGTVRAWHDGAGPSGPVRTDATAQVVRLFGLLDPIRYGAEIERAAAFLRACVDRRGGVPYEPMSADRTAWSTIFTAQALAPQGHPLRAAHGVDLV